MRIYLTATIKSKPEHVEELKALLEQLAVNAKTEKACIQYDLHQGIEDPLLFVFYEIWETGEGLALHNEQPYIKHFATEAPRLMQAPPIIHKLQLV